MLELPRMTAGRYTPRKSNLTDSTTFSFSPMIFAYFIAAFGPAPAAVRTPVGHQNSVNAFLGFMDVTIGDKRGSVWSLIRGGASSMGLTYLLVDGQPDRNG